jgi:hypothetical protein
MKKTLLSLITVFSISYVGSSQNIYTQGFDVTTAALITSGWIQTNQSSPLGGSTWTIPSTVPTATDAFGGINRAGHQGGPNSFALVNFNSTTGAGTISNWLITPVITVVNGDVVTFWSRKGTDGTTDFPDRLELRMSTAGAHITPTGGSAGVGSFTTVALTINPTLVGGFVYPKVWTQYSYTVTGVPVATSVKFAFRYFVTNGGPSGANSDIIGIDTFSVDTPLNTADFFSKNFSIYPNPVDNMLNLSSKTNTAINSVQIIDLNGRIVKSTNTKGVTESQINVSDLNTGMYFVEVISDEGKATSKFIKK